MSKEKMLLAAVEGKTEYELYFIDVSFMAKEGDLITAVSGPSCIPFTKDGELIGVTIEHPYEYEGEVFSYSETFTFEELRAS